MNDEIKEMLEQMESISITGKDKNGIKVDGYGLGQNELKILLDYITNLQEQLHQASLDIQELTERDIECPSWCDKLTNLQQEIKEANDSITWWTNRFKAVERDNRELKQENERIENEYKNKVDEIGKLTSRIYKAIEYIKKDTRWFDSEYASVYGELCDCEGYNANRLEVMVNPTNLLNILQNGSDENV